MTNEQILKKAIEKAEKNGWKHSKRFSDKSWHYLLESNNYFTIIFSHDFAKAFWGEEGCVDAFPGFDKRRLWSWHLQQMVLEKEPLKYIECWSFIK